MANGPPPPVAVTGATNTNPIVVSTAPNLHGFSPGDQVAITGVGGNTAANSPANLPWTVTPTSATAFSIPVAGSGAYTSGGLATSFSYVNAVASPQVTKRAPRGRAGVRDFIKAVSPPWLQIGVAEKLMYLMGLAIDAAIEKLDEAMTLHMPTVGDFGALPKIGVDRGIPQGLSEPNANYAIRLQRAFDSWKYAGATRSIFAQIDAYIFTAPTDLQMVIVDDSSEWDTHAAGSDATKPPIYFFANPANWNWDGITQWWRSWYIIYDPSNLFFTPGTAVWGGAGLKWGDTNRSWGFGNPPAVFTALRSILGLWKSAHVWYPNIIVTFDGTLFDQNKPPGDAHLPDGTFGTWAKCVAGVMVPSRFANARYIDGIA